MAVGSRQLAVGNYLDWGLWGNWTVRALTNSFMVEWFYGLMVIWLDGLMGVRPSILNVEVVP